MTATQIVLVFLLIGACMATYYNYDDNWGGDYYPYSRGFGAISGPRGWAVGGFGPRGGFIGGQRYPYYGGGWGGVGNIGIGGYPRYPSYKGKGFY